jgi:hypothetical protein
MPDTSEGPYGYESHRQELEAKLVGMAHSVDEFERSLANREYVPNRVMYERNKKGLDWVELRGAPSAEFSEPTPEKAKRELWDGWLDRYLRADIKSNDKPDPIPLFDTDGDGTVRVDSDGILRRSDEIDRKIRAEGKRCVSSEAPRENGYEGLLYVMYQFDDSGGIVPRYIGKAEAWGKSRALSSNFDEIAKDRSSTRAFARWGDGDYWHVGNLTNALRGDEDRGHTHWARALFEPESRRLKRETYLWVRAWNREDDIGPYHRQAYLAEVEPQLIGLAYHVHPESLLNKSGVPEDAPVKSRSVSFEPPEDYPSTSTEQGDLSEYEYE